MSGPGDDHRAGHRALSRLVPDPAAFAREVWGRRALLTPAAELPSGFADLLDEDAVDELVSSRGLRTPFLRVAKNGTTLPTSAFTSGAGVGAGIADQLDDTRLAALFADGATLVLQALHRTWQPVGDLVAALSTELGHPVQANAYVTPPQSRGFDDHYDVHDVFVLQVSGEKHWRIHDPVHPAPLRDQPWTDRRDAVRAEAEREPVIDAVLRPGDCLYLPRGHLHAATALGEVSTHLTLGIHTWTRHALADQLVGQALALLADDETVRGSLPLGVGVGSPDDIDADVRLVRERLHAAIDDVSSDAVAALMGTRADQGRPAPVGPLAQLRAARAGRGAVVLREHLRARLETTDAGTSLHSRSGTVPLDAGDVEAVRRLLAGETLDVADVGAGLAERLLTAGVVVPA